MGRPKNVGLKIIRRQFKLAGFTEWELYGDFDKSPYSYVSQEMIWIVKKG